MIVLQSAIRSSSIDEGNEYVILYKTTEKKVKISINGKVTWKKWEYLSIKSRIYQKQREGEKKGVSEWIKQISLSNFP